VRPVLVDGGAAGGGRLSPLRRAELDKFGANWPIYLDGMAKTATSIAMSHPEFVKDHNALHSAVENAIPLYENEERNKFRRYTYRQFC
jgi:predicted metal-dependent RNase